MCFLQADLSSSLTTAFTATFTAALLVVRALNELLPRDFVSKSGEALLKLVGLASVDGTSSKRSSRVEYR